MTQHVETIAEFRAEIEAEDGLGTIEEQERWTRDILRRAATAGVIARASDGFDHLCSVVGATE